MVRAYSRLKRVLDERQMTVPELLRRLKQQGLTSIRRASTASRRTINLWSGSISEWQARFARFARCP